MPRSPLDLAVNGLWEIEGLIYANKMADAEIKDAEYENLIGL